MEPMQPTGYDDLLDAVDGGRGFYLTCPDGHGSLPPRRVCPTCGTEKLEEEPLPDTGVIETVTRVHVPGPSFTGEAPVVAIADFGPVRLTGRVEEPADEADVDVRVSPTVATSQSGDRHLAFEIAERR